MKRRLFTAIAALALAGLLRAGDAPVYTPDEAAKHVGDTATVTGKIEDAHQAANGPAFLNMGAKHPNETFTIFINTSDTSAFKDVKDYLGKTVSITGKIKDHNGKPEIMAKSPSDLTVKDDASSGPAASASPKG